MLWTYSSTTQLKSIVNSKYFENFIIHSSCTLNSNVFFIKLLCSFNAINALHCAISNIQLIKLLLCMLLYFYLLVFNCLKYSNNWLCCVRRFTAHYNIGLTFQRMKWIHLHYHLCRYVILSNKYVLCFLSL